MTSGLERPCGADRWTCLGQYHEVSRSTGPAGKTLYEMRENYISVLHVCILMPNRTLLPLLRPLRGTRIPPRNGCLPSGWRIAAGAAA